MLNTTMIHSNRGKIEAKITCAAIALKYRQDIGYDVAHNEGFYHQLAADLRQTIADLEKAYGMCVDNAAECHRHNKERNCAA